MISPQKWILAMILAAIVGYSIAVPIYAILSDVVHLDPLVMLGIGLIMAVVLVKVFAKIGSFVTLGMIVFVGAVLIVIGISVSGG